MTGRRSRGRTRSRSNDAGKQRPPSGKRIKRAVGQMQSSISTQNQYQSLPDDDDGDSISSHYSSSSRVNKLRAKRSAVPPKREPPTPPPIVVRNATAVQVQKALGALHTDVTSKIQLRITKEGIKFYCTDDVTHVAVKQFCIKNGWQGFTYTPKQDRFVKFCLYGLWEMPISDLQTELQEKGIPTAQIKQLTIKNKRYNDEAIYLVYYKRSQGIKMENLRSVTGLFNVVVRFKY